jgi:hypothetical protein
MLASLPRQAAWRHVSAREGFEVVFVAEIDDGLCFLGTTSAVEQGRAWTVSYRITVDPVSWATRTAHVTSRSAAGEQALKLATDGAGSWQVDSQHVSYLDGCLDIDLEASALTNAFPARRLELALGQSAHAPAAYVRAEDLRVERLEQRYLRLNNDGTNFRFEYAAPVFNFECELVYDSSGLLLDYPGLAVRTGMTEGPVP